jgi:hypothetical protein
LRTIHASNEILPRFNVRNRQLSAGPASNHHFKEPLESLELLGTRSGGLKVGVQAADAIVGFQQPGQGALDDCFGLEFVELLKQLRLRPGQAGLAVGFSGDSGGLALTDLWAAINAVKDHLSARPVFAQEAALLFSFGRKLVVILFQK